MSVLSNCLSYLNSIWYKFADLTIRLYYSLGMVFYEILVLEHVRRDGAVHHMPAF